MKSTRFWVFIMIISVFFSCQKEIELDTLLDKFNGNQSLVIPLVSYDADVTSIVSNYLKDDPYIKIEGDEVHFVLTDSSSFLFHYLSFTDKVKPLSYDSYFVKQSITVQANNPQYFEIETEIDLGLNNNPDYEKIDSVLFEIITSKLEFSYHSVIQSNDIDSMVIRSERMTESIIFGRNQDTSTIINSRFYPGEDGKIPVKIGIYVKPPIDKPITPSTRLAFTFSLTDMDFKIAYGHFEPSVITRQVLTRRLVWNEFLKNSLLRFANPKIDVEIRTNVGANLRFEFDSVLATLPGTDNEKIYAEFDGRKSMSENLGPKPEKPSDEITYNIRTFDNEYGKTYLLFDRLEKPDSLIYAYGASLNQEAYLIDDKPDFLLSDSKVHVKIRTTLPFQLNEQSHYILVDTVTDISKSLSDDIRKIDFGKIDSVFLIIRAISHIPVSANINLQFADSEGSIIQTDIISLYRVESGRVDASGKATEPTENEYSVLLTKTQFETLRDRLDKLYITIKFEGMNEGTKIYITAKDKISVHAGIFLKNRSAE